MIRKDFKYKKIPKILTTNECDLLKRYHVLKLRYNVNTFDANGSSTPNMGLYSDFLGESLLLNKKKQIEEITGLELLPTYSYWRMYNFGSDLKKHIDRPSCEVSCTINVSTSGEKWPIFMDGTPIELEPGDGAVYLGMEVRHWREEFEGDYSSNLFLHYVDKNGKYPEYAKDKRIWYGQAK